MSELYMKYFVLKPSGEGIYAKASRAAIDAYAEVIRKENPDFAKELNDWTWNLSVVANKN